MRYICSFKDAGDIVISRCGGKGASLIRLTQMGIPVPEGFVIVADAFDNGQIKVDAHEQIKQLIATLSSKHTYAVRSSALNEDGSENSFAGQYETITDVPQEEIEDAIIKVIQSADNARVKEYTKHSGTNANSNTTEQGIAVVIQRFVHPTYAGVLFTADVITGSAARMVGNFVEGEGEALVSGQKNAREFCINAMQYSYEGAPEMRKFAKKLSRYASRIRDEYNAGMDIEWAVSAGRLFILQARPITTLRRMDSDKYIVNGSRSGEYLLTKTNVGEIFMKPMSPMTFGMLEIINNFLNLPCWLDSIEGQAYMNISVLCSMLISLGMSEQKAFDSVRDLVGNLPDGVTVPVFPFDGRKFRHNIFKLLFANGKKSGMSKRRKLQMVNDIPDIARQMIKDVRKINTNNELLRYGTDKAVPTMKNALEAIMSASGTKMVALFNTKNKIARLTDEDTANKLCSGLGNLASMKPMLKAQELAEGLITEEEYMNSCGHRCVNEMELSEKRPYEIAGYSEEAVRNYKDSGIDVLKMREDGEAKFEEFMESFKRENPSKARRIEKLHSKFIVANIFREDIRDKGVWAACVFREFLLAAGRINGIGDDIFMLYPEEALSLVKGDKTVLCNIVTRSRTCKNNQSNPQFPNLILGRFDPEEWVDNPARRTDFYRFGSDDLGFGGDVKGFPGAAGKVRGVVRVIKSIDEIDSLNKGEILVTCATNIGWTPVFPKAAAIVTDIGAPLSHAAIVAREFGIPAVVGCGNATTVLKTGDVVEVNGAAGQVTLVK